MEVRKMTIEELHRTIQECQDEIALRGKRRYEIHISSNIYKGCWIARVNENKEILDVIEPYDVVSRGYKREKIYFLSDGEYLVCSRGEKNREIREYITVENGKRKE